MALLSLLSCVALSSVVSYYNCDDDGGEAFEFKVFRFPGQTDDDQVYLRAKVIVCLSYNMASVCRYECASCGGSSEERKRRDTLEEIQQTEFYVTAGPFKIREPNQGL